MRINYIANVLGLIMIYFGVVILTPIIIALIYKDYFSIIPFLTASIISLITGLILRKTTSEVSGFNNLKRTEGLFIVVLTWTVISVITAIPYLFYKLSPINAIFEAISGVTTTGATILTDFSLYPKAFFFWRSMSQWLGGMGIIVLFIAILPQLAVAGRQLFFAEAPGPTEEKITPRVRHTASALWGVYIFLTVFQIILLILSGMHWLDAICNSFSTLAAGGFSPNPQSIMGYNSALIEWIFIIFMFLAGVNFALQYKVLVTGKPSLFFKNSEFKTYVRIIAVTVLILTILLFANQNFSLLDRIRDALFQVISIITTTGFASQDFETWDINAKIILFTMVFVGGSAGSGAGGIKVVRILLGAKYMKREIAQTLHPKAILPIKLDGVIVPQDVLRQTLAFIFFYITILFFSTVLVSIIEGSFLIGLTGTTVTLGNIGPGLGAIGPMGSFDSLSIFSKAVFCIDMLVGRLELIPFLVMFHPDFWYFKKA
jgi:trk system potassium uptake protein TrkH